MPVRSAKDNSVADSSCVEFDLSALTALDSRIHRYALILSWFIPGSGLGVGFCFELLASSLVFNVVSSFFVTMADCASFSVISRLCCSRCGLRFSVSARPVSSRLSLLFCLTGVASWEMLRVGSRGLAFVGWSSGGFVSTFSLVGTPVSVCSAV